MKNEWMIYGANGYSAQLAAEKAVKQGLKPILAGRNKSAVEAVASKLGLESRIFSLDSVDEVAKQLADIKVVSLCAGPFSATGMVMMQACIKAGTHYTDITGEIPVFEFSQSKDLEAKRAKVVLCNGVGFDIIPTDCLANRLQQELPDATHLTMGFDGEFGVSPGTAKTMVETIGEGMKVRRNGELVSVGRGFEMRKIDYGKGEERLSSVIPWGDLSTAYWQTKIPNISIYMPFKGPKFSIYIFPLIKSLMKIKAVQNFAKKKIDAKVSGPNEKTRDADETYLWGEVKNAAGKTVTARIKTLNGYTVTMDGIITTAKFLLEYEGEGGCLTPSQLMGSDLVEQLPGATTFKLAS